MKFSTTSLACIIAMSLSGITQAEIYETKDAQGNPVFTDTPTAGAQEIDLQKANIVDAVTATPQAAPNPPTLPAAAKSQQQPNVTIIPDSRNDELSQELAADRPHEVLEAEQRHEVGDNPTPEEIKRREEAREGEFVNQDGNIERVEHRGHVGGRR